MWYIALLASTFSCLKSVLFRNLFKLQDVVFFAAISKFVQKDIVVAYPQLSTTWDEVLKHSIWNRWPNLMVVSFGHVHHDPSSRTTWRNAKLTLRLRETNWSLKEFEFLFFFHYGRKRAECLAATSCVFPATAFTLQTAWATGPNDANRKRGRTQRAEDVNASDSVQISKLTISWFRTPNDSSNLYKLEEKKQDMVTWWKDTPGQFAEKKRLQEGWRCSRMKF